VNVHQPTKKRRHRGSIRTQRRVRYLAVGLAAALADPEMRDHVALLGKLFRGRTGAKVTVAHLTRALAAAHPTTGRILRARVNAGTRREGESRVANTCYGFDVTLSTDKSISIAALLLGDKVVLATALAAMTCAGRWLTRKVDRRIRAGGQNRTVETGLGAAFLLPEKAGRDGQPQLHAHIIFPNLTCFQDGERTRYCAAHFQRIAQLALAAQRRMHAQLHRDLVRLNYAADFTTGVCRLTSIPRALCDQLSPATRRIHATARHRSGAGTRTSRRLARMREDAHLYHRPPKTLKTLAEWQANWALSLQPQKLNTLRRAFSAARLNPPPIASQPTDAPDLFTVPVPTLRGPSTEEAELLLRPRRARERDEDDPTLTVRQLVGSFRQKFERECPPDRRPETVEVSYLCPEATPHLVEYTEALRSSLRRIFPRLVVHQAFTAESVASFTVIGEAASNPAVREIMIQATRMLEQELARPEIRAGWPALTRWLGHAIPAVPSLKTKSKPAGIAIPTIKPARVIAPQKPVSAPARLDMQPAAPMTVAPVIAPPITVPDTSEIELLP
jgi:conjugative relaxase-like TrwC/TraI family protein